MLLDSTYKTEAITEEMSEDEKVARILTRVAAFMSMSSTLMSGETQKRIIGDDSYSILVLDTVVKLAEGLPGNESSGFIRRELRERVFAAEEKRPWYRKRLKITWL